MVAMCDVFNKAINKDENVEPIPVCAVKFYKHPAAFIDKLSRWFPHLNEILRFCYEIDDVPPEIQNNRYKGRDEWHTMEEEDFCYYLDVVAARRLDPAMVPLARRCIDRCNEVAATAQEWIDEQTATCTYADHATLRIIFSYIMKSITFHETWSDAQYLVVAQYAKISLDFWTSKQRNKFSEVLTRYPDMLDIGGYQYVYEPVARQRINNTTADHIFALILLFGDGYLRCAPLTSESREWRELPAQRFLRMVAALPTELQYKIIAHHINGRISDIISDNIWRWALGLPRDYSITLCHPLF